MRARPDAGEPGDWRAGHLRGAHGRDPRAGPGARGRLAGQQGRRVHGLRPGDGGAAGAAVSATGAREYSGTRSVARKLALQALYRWQLNAAPWQDLVLEFKDAEDMARADGEYFRTLVEGVWHAHADLDARLASLADR